MIVTNRDKLVLDFIGKFKVATTDTIAELFYPNGKIARRRLKLLYDNKLLKREREHFTAQYCYYMNKPRQLRHRLLLTDFYRELHKIAEIAFFDNEFICENLRSDGLVVYKINGSAYVAFIEVQIANTQLDINKYEKLYRDGRYKKYFNDVFPLIVAITNKNIQDSKLKIIQINEGIENLSEIIEKDP